LPLMTFFGAGMILAMQNRCRIIHLTCEAGMEN
jgi:hypothetical protein